MKLYEKFNFLTCIILFYSYSLSVGAKEKVIIIADEISVSNQGVKLIATGNVKIQYGDYQLNTTELTYDKEKNLLSANHPIELKNKNVFKIIASSAEISDDFKKIIASHASALIEKTFYVRSQKMVRFKNGQSSFYSSIGTTCEVCPSSPVPMWQIKSEMIRHDSKKHQLHFKNARMEFLGLPVFYTPYLRIPEPGVKRATGLLTPKILTSDLLGVGLKQPFYLNLSRSSDVTFSLLKTSKTEKKLKPQLNFKLSDKDLLVVDSIAKYYSINIDSGEINWSKNSTYPFNSEIKKYKDKFFVVDYKNTLRCYYVDDGSECWNLQTEDSFTISNSKFSLIIIEDMVIFNNSIGDITAVDIETGMITWQLPTQSSSIINETYNFKISKLVSDNKSIYFSNNKNEFYSIDVKTGVTNWINDINSNLTPIIIGNLLFTVSNNGYLYVIEKDKGNIIRITDLYINYKIKKRKNINPVGFAIGNSKLFLTNTDGNMIFVDLRLGNITGIEKVTGNLTSKPFIFNQNLFVIRNGSIVQYN